MRHEMRIHPPQRTGILDEMPNRRSKDVALHTGSKGLIYLIHGVTGTPAEMTFLAHRLARCGWDVYVPILPGHCQRLRNLIKTTEKEWREYIYTQIRFAKTHYDALFVVGLSVGALLALDLASVIPVDGIGVLSPTLMYDGWNTPWSIKLLPWAMKLIPHQLQHLFFHVDGPPYGIKDQQLQADISSVYRPQLIFKEWLHSIRPQKFIKDRQNDKHAQITNSAGNPIVPLIIFTQINTLITNIRQSMNRITAPTIILQAKDDDMTSPRNAQVVYDTIGSKLKQLVLLDDSYHVITVDRQKDLVVKYLDIFFAKSMALKLNLTPNL